MKYVISIVIVFYAIYLTIKFLGNTKKSWLEIEGEILENHINELYNSTTLESHKSRTYEVSIKYSYSYLGKEYQSDIVYDKDEIIFDSNYQAEQFLEDYIPGSKVKVYIDEENPDSSCLISVTLTKKQELGIIFFVILIVALMIFFIIKFV
ncbi:MAG: DUF3592 domain-containing protein [Candidatus Cloacimonetes bacterium]|nr:DUF3592 domain-containing protein [Candidatus Cloacimonadota bacterium]